jgi:hypothetical protein
MERGHQVDINQSSLSKFRSNKSGSPRSTSETAAKSEVNKLKESAQTAATSRKQLDLKEGQIIKGQIIDLRYNEVRIQLEPQKQVVIAKLTDGIALSIGQVAQFQVTEDATDRIVLKYLPNEPLAPTDITIQKALAASNLPLTDRNKAIALELLNHRMPIDKQTLQTLIKLSHTNREASPLTLVLMYKHNIPMNPSNIKQYQAYQNGTHQLLNDIHTITKNLSLLLEQPEALLTDKATEINPNPMQQSTQEQSLPGLEPFHKAFQINHKLIDILFHNPIPSDGAISLPISDFLNQEELSQLGKSIEQLLTNQASIPAGMLSDTIQQITQGNISMKDVMKFISTLPSDNNGHMPPYEPVENPSKQQLSPDSSPLLQGLIEKYALSQEAPAKLDLVLNTTQRSALLELLKTFPGLALRKSQLAEGNLDVREILTYINENLSQVEETVAKNLLQSPEYRKLLEGAFQQKWMLTPEKLTQKASISDLYQTLQEDLVKISTLEDSDKMSLEANRLQEPVKNLQENLRFMKDLNEMYTYLQLPLQFQEREVHSDLYVFTKKNTPPGTEKNLSVLLHLTMEHLGSLNIHIQMDHNLIKAKFYPEASGIEQLISDHLPMLNDALLKKGFQLQAEVLDTYEKPDFSNDFIEQGSTDTSIQRYTFDIRT